jgi:hypothetical protein
MLTKQEKGVKKKDDGKKVKPQEFRNWETRSCFFFFERSPSNAVFTGKPNTGNYEELELWNDGLVE